MRLKSRPDCFYEDIVRLNKIVLEIILVIKIDFSKFSFFETRYKTKTEEKPLRIHIKRPCGEFVKI